MYSNTIQSIMAIIKAMGNLKIDYGEAGRAVSVIHSMVPSSYLDESPVPDKGSFGKLNCSHSKYSH